MGSRSGSRAGTKTARESQSIVQQQPVIPPQYSLSVVDSQPLMKHGLALFKVEVVLRGPWAIAPLGARQLSGMLEAVYGRENLVYRLSALSGRRLSNLPFEMFCSIMGNPLERLKYTVDGLTVPEDALENAPWFTTHPLCGIDSPELCRIVSNSPMSLTLVLSVAQRDSPLGRFVISDDFSRRRSLSTINYTVPIGYSCDWSCLPTMPCEKCCKEGIAYFTKQLEVHRAPADDRDSHWGAAEDVDEEPVTPSRSSTPVINGEEPERLVNN